MATQFPSLAQVLAADSSALREIPVSQEVLVQGKFLRMVRDTVTQTNGKTATREYIEHPGAVVIVPILEDGRVLVEYQYRHALGGMFLEFPAGKIDPGEDHWRCAARELLEETGLRAQEWAYAGQMHNCIGYSDEFIDIWFARGMQQGMQALEEGELLHLGAATPQELLTAMRNGQLTDAKTLTCMLWLQQLLDGGWQPEWQTLQEQPA